MNDKNVMCIIEVSDKGSYRYGLLASQDPDRKIWMIHAFESVDQGLWYWEEAYRLAHERGQGTSACISFIFTHPSVVELTLQEVEQLVATKSVEEWSNMTDRLIVIPLKQEAKAVWEAGKKPALIKEEWGQPGFHAKQAMGG